jgi:hypothetical protein
LEKGSRAVFSAPAKRYSASRPNLTREQPIIVSHTVVTATWGPPIGALSSAKSPSSSPASHRRHRFWPLPCSVPSPGACRRCRPAAASHTHAVGSSCPLAHRGVMSPCCAGRLLSRPLRRHDAGAKSPVTRPHLGHRPATLVHVGTVRWHAHTCHVATTSTLPVQLTTSTPVYGQNSHPSCALHGACCLCAA